MALTKVSSGLISADASSVDLNIDAGTLYIDATNNRVGIGATSPSEKLEVAGNIFVNTSGNPNLTVKTSGAGNNPNIRIQADINYWDLQTLFSNANNELDFRYNGSSKMIITNSGNVGIGTTSPESKFNVHSGGSTFSSGTLPAGMTLYGNTTDGQGSMLSFKAENGDQGVAGIAGLRSSGYQTELRFYTNNTNSQNAFSERMRIDSSGNVGIGLTPASTNKLEVFGNIKVNAANDKGFLLGGNCAILRQDSTEMGFETNGSERMRIDSSGNLLLNATSNTSRGGSATKQLIKFGSGQEYLDLQSNNATTNSAILFSDGSTGNYGAIRYRHTGDSLEFMTAATERMRIHDDGKISINEQSDAGLPAQLQVNSSDRVINAAVSNTGFTSNNTSLRVERTANSGFQFLLCRSGARYDGSGGDTEFNLRGDGNAYADGSWNGGGADYAEYFEWNDGNSSNEDRVGYAVSLVGNKIKIAESGEEVIGVISGNPSVVGDAAWNNWQDKYLKDDFGRYLWEEYADEEGNTTDDNGDLLKRRVLNPDYDDSLEYQPREDRQEWDVVGLMGKLRVRVGQQTNSNWIKLRDISDTVEEWLVR